MLSAKIAVYQVRWRRRNFSLIAAVAPCTFREPGSNSLFIHEAANDLFTDDDPAMTQFPPKSAIAVGVVQLRTDLMKHVADMRILIRSTTLVELEIKA